MDIERNPTPQEVWRALQRIGAIALGREVVCDVGTTETEVKHYLGRVPTSWVEVSPANGAAAVKQSAAPDSTVLRLIASSAVTGARLWVW